MATYAIGDVHGCLETLERLLDRLDFDADRDRLWLVGDLVNRGPESAGVLRWARRQAERMGERFVTVLGNHDLHLLAAADGVAPPRPNDTFDGVLTAADRDELVGWLRRRPLLHLEDGYLVVHAGLLPEWSVATALELARSLSTRLASPESAAGFLHRPTTTGDLVPETRRLQDALYAFTRLRMLTEAGEPSGFAGSPEEAPAGLRPWFDLDHHRGDELTVITGHWAALGVRLREDLIALDSGCAWGNELTAIRLDDRHVVSLPAYCTASR